MRGLLNRKHNDSFVRLHICESQRQCLRRFLYGIQTRLPQTVAKIYPNDDPCTPITNMSPEYDLNKMKILVTFILLGQKCNFVVCYRQIVAI